jgi:ABC-2 type transport system ATP-binding protein
MDQKLKNYSSGMQVRLAFSIAVRAEAAILLIDEVLAVGDLRFQQKCYDYFYKLKRENQTIVFVSHDMESMQKFCDRAMVIHDGAQKFIGRPTEAAIIYKELNSPSQSSQQKLNKKGRINLKLKNSKGEDQSTFLNGEVMTVDMSWEHNPRAQFLGVAIHRDDGMYIFGTNNIGPKRAISEKQQKAKYYVELNLGNGSYYIEVAVFGKDESDRVLYTIKGPSFIVHNSQSWQGLTELRHHWDIT